MVELLGLLPEDIAALLPGAPAYRSSQVFRWLHRGVRSFAEMGNLPLTLRAELASLGVLTLPSRAVVQTAPDGTTKTLWRFEDGQGAESVLMTHRYGKSLCLSTQVGCRQGCVFCASAIGGLVRNLTAAEMLSMVIFTPSTPDNPRDPSAPSTPSTPDNPHIARAPDAPHTPDTPSAPHAPLSIVLMGMGEPLDNFAHTVRFLTLINHPGGLGVSLRRVSLSTCGLVGGIRKLASLRLPVTLSVSLHAPDDETRSRLVPVNRQAGIPQLLVACRDYFDKTGRRVSYEYTLFDGVNDTPDKAHHLGRLLSGAPAHVNLIAMNPTGRAGALHPSKPGAVRVFQKIAASYGLSVTLRRSLGGGIDAACGQLRNRFDGGAIAD